MNTKRFIAIAGGVLAVIILIAAITYFNRQQTRMDELASDITYLRSEFSANMDFKLSILKGEIFEELTRQNSNVFDASYTIGDLNAKNNTATIHVTFSLKEYNASDPVSIHYQHAGKAKSVTATRDDNIFSADLPVEIGLDQWSGENTYEISYSTGTDSVHSEKIMTMDPTQDFYDRIEFNVWTQTFSYNYETQIAETQIEPISIMNRFGSDAKLKFVSCKLQIRFKDKLVHETNIMASATIEGEYQVFHMPDPIFFEWNFEGLNTEPDWEATSGPQCFLVATDEYGFEYDLPTDFNMS